MLLEMAVYFFFIHEILMHFTKTGSYNLLSYEKIAIVSNRKDMEEFSK